MGSGKFRRRSIPGVDVAHLDCTGVSFAKHSHDEFVLSANLVGREHVWVGGCTFDVMPSHSTLYNPGEVQAAQPAAGDWKFVSLYVDPRFVAENVMDRAIAFRRPVSEDPRLSARIKGLCREALSGRLGDDQLQEAVIVLLDRTLSASGELSLAVAPLPSPAVLRTAERLLDQIASPPCLRILSAAEGLSPVQLVRRFSAERGVPPFTWLNMQRLMRARKLIQQGLPLARIAAELGFADQAHLTRRFKAMYSVTPGTWRRSS